MPLTKPTPPFAAKALLDLYDGHNAQETAIADANTKADNAVTTANTASTTANNAASQVAGKYEKPATGIPLADLATAVTQMLVNAPGTPNNPITDPAAARPTGLTVVWWDTYPTFPTNAQPQDQVDSRFTATVATPGQIRNLATSDVTSSGATATWSSDANSASYRVDYKTDAGTTYTSATTTSTSMALTGLNASTAYDVRVLGVNSAGTTTPLPAGWAASTAYTAGAYVRAVGAADPDLIFEVTTAGTSGTTQPAWPTAAGGTVVDGGVTWTARARIVTFTTAAATATTTVHSEGFEAGTGSYNASNSTISRSQERVAAGAYSLKAVVTNGASRGGAVSRNITVTPGKTYSFSVKVSNAAASARTIGFKVDQYGTRADGTTGYITESTWATDVVMQPGSSFTTVTGSQTARTGNGEANQFNVRIMFQIGSEVVAGDTFYLDDVVVTG